MKSSLDLKLVLGFIKPYNEATLGTTYYMTFAYVLLELVLVLIHIVKLKKINYLLSINMLRNSAI